MRDIRNMQSKNSWNNILTNSYRNEPAATDLATSRATKILDAKCEKADITAIIQENCNHLEVTKQQKLLKLLQEFEELFDGTLGEWNTSHAKLNLKPGTLPVHVRA